MAVTINGTTGIVTPDIGVDGTTLVVDAVNNRIGIGQSSPTTTLDVNGTGNVSSRLNVGASSLDNRALSAYNTSTTVGAVSATNYNTNGLLFYGYNASVDANNASFVVKSDGSIGVGLNTPAAQLHLSGPAEIRLNNATDAGNFARIRCFEESSDNGAHLAFNTGAGEVVRFRNDGNVAINSAGTANNLLDIRKDATSVKTHIGTINGTLSSMPNSSEYGISIVGGNVEFGLHKDGSGNYQAILGTYQGSIDIPLVFRTGNRVERLRIDNVGSAQFTGQDSPSGRNTRISRYGSLLVGTTGELISNARCAIDSGNGDVKTIGNIESSINTSTYQTGINLHTSSNLSTLTVYSNNSSTHRSFVVYDNGQSVNVDKYRAAIYANGNILGRRLFLGGSTNGGFDYNAIADTLEFLTTNGGTHSELNATAYVPGTNGGKNLGQHNKRWNLLFCNGIRFGGDNVDSKTLDDYEEGSWTPVITSNGTHPTYTVTSNYSYYIKIGRLVHFNVDIYPNMSSVGSGGSIYISIPFAVDNSSGNKMENYVGGMGGRAQTTLNLSRQEIGWYYGGSVMYMMHQNRDTYNESGTISTADLRTGQTRLNLGGWFYAAS